MTTPSAGRGLTTGKLLAIAGFFLIFHVVSLAIERVRIPDIAHAELGDLSFVIIFELLSWAAYPILAFCYLVYLGERGASARVLGATVGFCVLTEVAYDLLHKGSLVDFSSQSFVWAFPLCFVIYVAGERLWDKGKKLPMLAVVLAALLWIILGAVGVRFQGFYPGAIIIIMFLTFHYLKGRENTMMMSAALMGATCGLAPAFGVVFLHYRAPLVREYPGFPPAGVVLILPVALALVGLWASFA